MNALLHQLGAEVRSFRGYYLVWFALLVMHVAGVVAGEYWEHHPLKNHPLLVLFRLSGLWTFLAALILCKAVPFNDPPLDPDAFWRTKPLSGRTLMWAKILAVGIVFVLPVLIIEGWVAGRMGGPGAAGAVALDQLMVRWGAMVALMGLAALAGNPMRLLGLVLGGLFVLGSVTGVLSHVTTPSQFDHTPTLIASRILVAGVCGWVGSVLVLHLLYQRQQLRPAGAAAGVTAGLLGAVFLVWPVDFYRYAAEDSGGHLNAVTLDIHDATLAPNSKNPGDNWRLRMHANLPSSCAGLAPRMHKAHLTLGSPVKGGGWAPTVLGHQGGAGYLADQIALLNLPDPSPGLNYRFSTLLRRGAAEGASVSVQVEAEIDLFDYVPVGELTLEAGSTLRLDQGEIEVMSLAWTPGNLLIEIREQVLQPIFAFRGPVTVLPRGGHEPLWTLVLPPVVDGLPAQFSRSEKGRHNPPGQNETSLLCMMRYRHDQFMIQLREPEPNSVDAIEAYRGRRVQVLQRVYRGSIERTAELTVSPGGAES